MNEYIQKWVNEFSPKAWGFVSFILPLIAVPLAISVATKGAELVKKEMAKRKKK